MADFSKYIPTKELLIKTLKKILPLVAIGLMVALSKSEASRPTTYLDPSINFSDTYQYYSIEGDTIEELNHSMVENYPYKKDENDSTIALTSWEIGHNIEYGYNQDNKCSLSEYGVTMNSITTLPEWKGKTQASLSMQRNWFQRSMGLFNHEDVHKQTNIRGAQKLYEALGNIGSYDTCEQLTEAVDSTANGVYEWISNEGEYYDRTKYSKEHHGIFP